MQVYTIPEAAKLLKAAPITVKRLLLRGELNGFKLGTHWRITDQDLAMFIETHRPKWKKGENTGAASTA